MDLFQDCLAQRLLTLDLKQTSASDAASNDDLVDFAQYLTSEIWPALPPSIHSLSHETPIAEDDIPDIPLDSLPLSVFDSLVSYGYINPNHDDSAQDFVRHVLKAYIPQACAPPPVWTSTRTKECEICEREIKLTYHHLIPKSTHEKVKKRGWHPEDQLGSVAWLCRPCHNVVHHGSSGEELARYYYTVEKLLERPDIEKWRRYAAKQR
ncbi:hypothetical protein SISNIDRAFT_470132 [Sistotremastrum niveocremeum HHB9708]|uniref:HNH domain-containing protein n=2 Tax=Sistotremastraceae TaxID=3402574 RepID=A0A164PA94_9AGAM|nr:hypothetical protein SISNIDRAFT_470132 [Sistotremastrum niveocremeum HHB9708]KZT34120.1 hypothetical protein SISSUDRAFT_1036544 [Sistotremastrum suecicum HHB10207 ss-3]